MRKDLFASAAMAACIAALSATAAGMAGPGFPKAGDEAAKTIRADFKAPPPGYGEVPFWWWSGPDRIDKGRLLEQIEELHKAGIVGVQVNYSHYRTSFATQDSDPALFTPEWWDVFAFAAKECARRGMGISLSNYTLDIPERENLWRKLGISTRETRATELAYVNGKIVKRKVPGTYDPLDPEAGKRVVERFFDPFMEKVPEEARGALNYFFQDELVLGRGILWMWTDDLPAEFKKRKGYDIEPLLPALFTDFGPDTAKVRLDMNDVMSALACERYFKPIYDWHASRGLVYGCDQATRGTHPMKEYIDYMRTMKYFTAPGFDTPGRSADIIKNKTGSSIAHLNRRPRVWLEGYHSQGWQASTSTIFDSTCHNYLYGSNLLNLHGLYYSTYGGWWEWAPPCYHFRMPYWTCMKTFLKYFERLSFMLSQGEHVCDVAVVNPLEPCVYNRDRGNVSVGVAHDIVRRLVTEAQTDVDFIDADSLARAGAKDGRLRVAGEAYRMVVVPDMIAIKRASLEKLVAFKRAGGKVAVLGAKPLFTDAPHTEKTKIDALVKELCEGDGALVLPAKPSAAELAKIAGAAGTPDFRAPGAAKALHRRIGAYDVYFVCDLAKTGECVFRAAGTPELWNPWDGSQEPLPNFRRNADGTTTVKIEGDGAPKLVVFSPGGGAPRKSGRRAGTPQAPERKKIAPMSIDGDWDFTPIPTLDNKHGDFRLPVRERFIGPEIRRVEMQDAEKYGLPSRMTVSFGPQFIDESTSKPFLFSWREGAEGMPGFQDWHHGLNGRTGDDFFVLGPYDRRFYDVRPKRGAKPEPKTFKTFVYAPCDCKARPVAHGVAPEYISIDGAAKKAGEEVGLAAGYHELSVRYRAFGRAALVMMRTDVKSEPSKVPLSMRWHDDPAVLRFDPFGGKIAKATYTATLPPACEEISVRLRGTLISAKIGGEEAEVAQTAAGSGEKICTVKPKNVPEGVAALSLEIAHEPGHVGGAAFTEPVRLKCGKGKISLGNWARKADGLMFYSGGAVYEKTFTLTKEQAERYDSLVFGGVGACCKVSLNGGAETTLCCPPWRVDAGGKLKEGENVLRVEVYNTLNNHYQTIPTRYRTSIDRAQSGLSGPVTLEEK